MKTHHLDPPRENRLIRAAAATLLGLLFAGSATAAPTSAGGTLQAVWKPSDADDTVIAVSFSFHREQLGAGRLSVKLGDPGENFVGNYLRLTGTRPLSSLRVFHTHWVSDDFENFKVGPTGAPLNRNLVTIEQFQRRYTGSVVATLAGSQGGAMRCVFTLLHPNEGLVAGATGRCQTSDGGIVDLVEPKRR